MTKTLQILSEMERFNPHAIGSGFDTYVSMKKDVHGDYYNREAIDTAMLTVATEQAMEIERLKLALCEIRKFDRQHGLTPRSGSHMEEYDGDCGWIAREALGVKP